MNPRHVRSPIAAASQGNDLSFKKFVAMQNQHLPAHHSSLSQSQCAGMGFKSAKVDEASIKRQLDRLAQLADYDINDFLPQASDFIGNCASPQKAPTQQRVQSTQTHTQCCESPAEDEEEFVSP